MNVYNSIMQGLTEAVEYEKGNAKYRVSPLPDIQGAEIRKIRMSLNMTQEVFAKVMGVSKKTVEAWEGERCNPSGTAIRMLFMLKTDPELLEKHNILKRK